MKERGLLFSAPMVRALLAGAKTQTRRLDARLTNAVATFVGQPVEPEAVEDLRLAFSETGHSGPGWYASSADYPEEGSAFARCPYGVVGDRLWVRETFAIEREFDKLAPSEIARAAVEYLADGKRRPPLKDVLFARGKTRVSIHMPRWASRITLELAGVRVERLQDISAEDAIAEGIDPDPHRCGCERCAQTSQICPATASSLVLAYAELWCGLHGAESWDANPWVWALTFKRVTP